MKKTAAYILYTLLLAAVVCACSDDLDILQAYTYDLVCMPVQKNPSGRNCGVRCQLVKEGNYEQARFFIRYFQPDGVGELKMDDGTVFLPNDLYPLDRTLSDSITLPIVPTNRLSTCISKIISGRSFKRLSVGQNDNGDSSGTEDEK